ncbi:unnamed protein product [Mytilus coruscus]|uniref:Integrase zinc-binding domain-containing protein n=1 Tax=Mytilus coruscus TaxID=42192 RepID=A0A6J8DXV6_MYTCO|nr:unnamed protein product [Mytilus coruscus]
MSESKSQIKSVCDNYLRLRGKRSFTLDFGEEKFTSEAVVTDLHVDCILGLDFMKKNKCLIDVSTNLLHIDNFLVPVIFQGTKHRNADTLSRAPDNHIGLHQTGKKIRQSYYWSGLQSDARAYVTGRDKCARRKIPTERKRASVRLEQDNGRCERKRPAWMADNEIE